MKYFKVGELKTNLSEVLLVVVISPKETVDVTIRFKKKQLLLSLELVGICYLNPYYSI